MQISVSIDSDQTQNGQPPKILGTIGHPRYNEFSVLTNFVLTGFHCTCMMMMTYVCLTQVSCLTEVVIKKAFSIQAFQSWSKDNFNVAFVQYFPAKKSDNQG